MTTKNADDFRYEVQCLDLTTGSTDYETVGYTDDPQRLLGMIERHPEWHSPRVIDRRPLEPPPGWQVVEASVEVDSLLTLRYGNDFLNDMLQRQGIARLTNALAEKIRWREVENARPHSRLFTTAVLVRF